MDIAMEYMILFLFFGHEEYCFEEELKTRDLFLRSLRPFWVLPPKVLGLSYAVSGHDEYCFIENLWTTDFFPYSCQHDGYWHKKGGIFYTLCTS